MRKTQSDKLRERWEQHKPKNVESKKQEDKLNIAINCVRQKIFDNYHQTLLEYRTISIDDILDFSKKTHPEIALNFKNHAYNEKSYINPDGGFLAVDGNIVLITECKKQGTNKDRMREGKGKQALGNAIERFGKNLIAFQHIFHDMNFLPVVCFGHGCDFAPSSSILDRVLTLNNFFPLNKEHFYNIENYSPASIYCREEEWSVQEMAEIMYSIASQSIEYYLENNIKNIHELLLTKEKLYSTDGLFSKPTIRSLLSAHGVIKGQHYKKLRYRTIKKDEEKPKGFNSNQKYKSLELTAFNAESSPLNLEEINELIGCSNIVVF